MHHFLRSASHLWLLLTVVLLGTYPKAHAGNDPILSKSGQLVAPAIYVTPSALTFVNSTQLPGSNPKSYTLSASGLTADLQIIVPSRFVASADGLGNSISNGILVIPAPNGVVEPIAITVALLSSSPGSFNGVISNVSGSVTATVGVSGTTLSPTLSVDRTALTGFSTPIGTPSAVQTYTVTALSQTGGSVSAPTGVEIRAGSDPFGTSVTIPTSLTPVSIPIDVRLTGTLSGTVSGVITHRLFNSSNQSLVNVAVSGLVTEPTVPAITVTPSSLTILNYSEYEGQYPASYTVSANGLTDNLVINAPPYYWLSSGGNLGPSLTIHPTDGIVPPTSVSVILLASSAGTFNGVITNTSGSATATVAVSGTALDESVTVSPTVLSPFTTTADTPSAVQSYTVTSRGGLTVLVSAPAGFEIRTGSNSFSSGLTIGPSLTFINTPIDVRLKGTTTGPISGTISHDIYYHSSHGVYTVAVSGVVSASATPVALSVSHLDADYGNRTDHIIRPYLQLNNEGPTPIDYSQITLRYWFTAEGNSPPTDFQVYYAQLGTNKVRMRYVALSQPRQGAFGYVEYSFDASAGRLVGNSRSGPIENGILKQDRSNFNEADDYSYAPPTQFTKNARITAYLNGMLVWGQEPAEVPVQQRVKAYSAAKNSSITSSISTVVELRNEGNVAIPLQDLKFRYWFTSETSQSLNIYVDWAQLGAQTIQRKVVRLANPVTGADSYAELGFAPTPLNLSPLSSTGDVLFRLVKPDFSLLNQANDYSSGPVTLIENPRITVYLGGNLIYGSEPSGAMARLGVAEEVGALQAVILGNPITSGQAMVEVRGVQGQPVRLQVYDGYGRGVAEQHVKEAGAVERQLLEMGQQPAGLYLLRVSTPDQIKTLKLIKP